MEPRDQERKIENLRKKLEDLKGRLPAHSVKPAMIQELEQLEEELEALLKKRSSAEK